MNADFSVYQYESSTNGAFAIIIADLNSNQMNDFDPIVIGKKTGGAHLSSPTCHLPCTFRSHSVEEMSLVPVHSMYTKDLPVVALKYELRIMKQFCCID
jgi:hypothetical protein